MAACVVAHVDEFPMGVPRIVRLEVRRVLRIGHTQPMDVLPILQTHQFASTAAAAGWRGTTVVVVVLLAGPVVLSVLAHVR